MGKSQMIERIEKENFENRLGRFLVLGAQLMVFLLVGLGFFGLFFLILFSMTFGGFALTGTASEGLKYWYPGLFCFFLFFFKFPRLNIFWEKIFQKLAE